ncbi:MAG: protein translocase subunit SecDF, partial [Eubacteriales bacterium]|nr:protein translocase subunit SecDF [Eubacteriales bacterium]
MNYSRAVGVARFVLVILCIALLMSVAVCGVDAWGLGGIFDDGTVVLGLDLSGGSRITYSAVTDDTGSSLSEGMDSILQAMRTRLDNSGYTEANVYLVGDNMITVEIPGIDDPNEAVKSFGSMGKLTFRNTDGETVLTGEDVAKAQAVYAQTSDGTYEYQVSLSFTEEGSKKFAAATKAAVGKTIAIYMDEELLSQPNVKEEITGGEASISSGNMTLEYAKMLAGNINAGALKYELKLEELRSIGPTLGEKSLQTSLQAGLIGVCLVAVFLIAVYRIPGLMASVSMVAYLALFMLCISVFKINLTLPGIAGVVLS